MEEGMIFYSQEVHESVALYLIAHACRVQVERQPPDYVFHKVTCPVQSCMRHGGGDQSLIHRYYLSDGAIFFGQTLRAYGTVPGHPNDYWTTLHIDFLLSTFLRSISLGKGKLIMIMKASGDFFQSSTLRWSKLYAIETTATGDSQRNVYHWR